MQIIKDGAVPDGFGAAFASYCDSCYAANIGHCPNCNTTCNETVVKGWMNSTLGEKENILGRYTHTGIGVFTDDSYNKYYIQIFK